MNEQAKYRHIKSPCISVCEYNDYYYCTGCKRHMDEIIDWLDYTDQQRDAVMKELDARDIEEPSDATFKTY